MNGIAKQVRNTILIDARQPPTGVHQFIASEVRRLGWNKFVERYARKIGWTRRDLRRETLSLLVGAQMESVAHRRSLLPTFLDIQDQIQSLCSAFNRPAPSAQTWSSVDEHRL